MHKFIPLIIFLFSSVLSAKERSLTSEEIDCGLKEDKSNGIEYFVEMLKKGETLDDKTLIENE